MTKRERVLTALRKNIPDRIPKSATFIGEALEQFKKKTGAEDPAEYFDYETRYVDLGTTGKKTDFSPYHPTDLPHDRTRFDEWGIGWVRGSMYHFEDMIHPMIKFTTLKEFEDYPYPDVDAPYRRVSIKDKVIELQNKGFAVVGVPPMVGGTIFETAWRMRGLDNMLVDMMDNHDLASYHFDRITEMAISNADFLAGCNVDILLTGDDIATQRGMMMSLSLWREWIKPRFTRVIKAAKEVKPDILIFYHSCGKVEDAIPELIEIGVDILNPVQAECMDPEEMKKRYGDKLSFWGTVGTQTTLPFGKPEEVEAVVKKRIETVGKGGGLLIAPTHCIEPDVPWENVLAFFNAVEKYGRY